MPHGSEVERIYRALVKKGYDKGKAARISQAQSGEALATGQPPKHHKMGTDQHEGEPVRLSPEDWLDGLCEAMGCHQQHA